MTTPARWALEVLSTSLSDVSRMTGVSEALIDQYIDETFINNDAGYTFSEGCGMPQIFARDLAMGLGIHRGALDCDLDNRLKCQMFRNTVPAIDGNYGTCHIHLPGKTGENLISMFRIPQSSASDFIMPQVGEAVSFLDDRFDVHVLQLEKMVRFRTEEGVTNDDQGSDGRFHDVLGPGLNPETVLGAFEILMHVGPEAFFDVGTRAAFPGLMSEAYVLAIQRDFEGWNMSHLLERLLKVRIHLTSGEQFNYHLKAPYSPMLDEFYRLCRNGRLPPFLIMNEDHWVECVPTSEISMVSIPWVLIAKFGAHIDAECGGHNGEGDLFETQPDPVNAWPVDEDEEDDEDTIVLTDDTIARKKP